MKGKWMPLKDASSIYLRCYGCGSYSAVAVITLLVERQPLEDRIDYITEGLTVDEVLDAQERELSQEEKEKARIAEKIRSQVRNQPDKAAELIKAWLNEDLR